MARLNIGTSGWHYDHWRGVFYPDRLDPSELLSHYCRYFKTVEVNNTFYRLPSESALSDWREAVPRDFLFSIKASRFMTHLKKLKDFQKPLETFLERIDILEGCLGPVLFQLPPRWKFNSERLRSFAEGLPDGYRFAFEFRDATWYDSGAFDILRERGLALCLHDMAGSVSPHEATADFIYVRLHGPQRYGGRYDRREMSGWANAFSAWMREGKDIFCYFNNDDQGNAVRDALEMKRLLNALPSG
ncbi:MAG: DUF72 domain-containing protein [Desulfobacterales bacterium]